LKPALEWFQFLTQWRSALKQTNGKPELLLQMKTIFVAILVYCQSTTKVKPGNHSNRETIQNADI